MKKNFVVAAILMAALSLPAIAQQAKKAEAVAEPALLARYALMDKGMEKGDVPAYLSVAVADLVTIDDDALYATRKDFVTHLSKDISAFTKIDSFTSKITHLQTVPDFVRANVTSTFVGDMPDKKDASVIHHYSVDLHFQHEWRKISGVWQLTRFVELGATVTKDGKVLPEHP